MDIKQATALAQRLHRGTRPWSKYQSLQAKVVTRLARTAIQINGRFHWAQVEQGQIVFTGGRFGDHALELSCSDEARIVAHWDGYMIANGVNKPVVGALVDFPSASASSMGGYRTGRVLSVGAKHAKIGYRFKYQRGAGHLHVATVSFDKIRY